LNPKSLVSTTNKLQQFVAEVERLECLTLRRTMCRSLMKVEERTAVTANLAFRLAPGKVVAQGAMEHPRRRGFACKEPSRRFPVGKRR
jgi:hypothetical protein